MKIVFTKNSKQPDDKVICQSCKKTIANLVNDKLVPSFEECYKQGNIPVPNFGWLCSYECAVKFEIENDINFMRTSEGKIDYYKGQKI
jgi:hypothetical protein